MKAWKWGAVRSEKKAAAARLNARKPRPKARKMGRASLANKIKRNLMDELKEDMDALSERRNIMRTLEAPFPYFGGKRKAAEIVWRIFGNPKNYVEPFMGSAAMLLARPETNEGIETVNDKDGFISNFWRAVKMSPDEVAFWCDFPVSETDLVSRHLYLVEHSQRLNSALEADPMFYDAKIAGWWVWGACAWIGSGWCSGKGPWIKHNGSVIDRRKLPHISNAGMGVNRKLPHIGDAGRGVNAWMLALAERLRRVRVTCGDWRRVMGPSATVKHGMTAIFLDPPYTQGEMDYAAGGCGGGVASDVRGWCAENGGNLLLKIALCGHDGEHDDLLSMGWTKQHWKAGAGYARSDQSIARRKSETIWFSPACIIPPIELI